MYRSIFLIYVTYKVNVLLAKGIFEVHSFKVFPLENNLSNRIMFDPEIWMKSNV